MQLNPKLSTLNQQTELLKFYQRMVLRNDVALFNVDLFDASINRGDEHVFHLHCFEYAQLISLLHLLPFAHKYFLNVARHE